MGAGRPQAVTGGVVQHADADEQPGLVQLAITRHHLQVGAALAPGHRQHPHAQCFEPRELDCPARLLDHDRVSGSQQGAADDVERVGGADRGDDLVRAGLDVDAREFLRQRAAQADVSRRFAVLQRERLQRLARAQAAHGPRQEWGLQPVGREHTHTRLWLVAGGVEHAPDQSRGIDRGALRWQWRRRSCRSSRWRRCGYRLGAGFAHEEPAVAPGLHQAQGRQPVVRRHYGGRADRVLLRALANRWQPRTRGQQPGSDPFGKPLRELLGQ